MNPRWNIGRNKQAKLQHGIDGAHRRAYMTVLPLAQDLGLTVDDHCSRSDAECVADTIRSYNGPGNILIAWRHKNIPEIQKFLGSEHPLKYPVHRYVHSTYPLQVFEYQCHR